MKQHLVPGVARKDVRPLVLPPRLRYENMSKGYRSQLEELRTSQMEDDLILKNKTKQKLFITE